MLPPRKPASRESELRDKSKNERQKAILLREVALNGNTPNANRLVQQSTELCSESGRLVDESRRLIRRRKLH